jgi:hypothetical protein
MSARRDIAIGAGATALLGPLAYALLFRRQCLTWGTIKDEASGKLPGDDLLPDAGLVATRAITVKASPGAIWPWLVQMGSGRGGAYTYDWIENLLGLGMHSANEILPEFQGLKIGDEIPMGRGQFMQVEELDTSSALVVRSKDLHWVWSFTLVPQDDGTTRLISRNRIDSAALPRAGRFAYLLIMEPGSLIMERKMLIGIKQRAEASEKA